MISFQPSENNFEMKVQNSYHRYRGATMHFSEARHSEGNIRALRKSQPLIKGDPSCWTDIRLHRKLTPNFGVSQFHLRSILKQNHIFGKISYEKQVFQCLSTIQSSLLKSEVESRSGYTKTHSLPSKILPFRSKTITKTGN